MCADYLNLAVKSIEFERKVRIVRNAAAGQNGAAATEGKETDDDN